MRRVTLGRVLMVAALLLASAGVAQAQHYYATFMWEGAAPAPLARLEAQGAVVDGKLYIFGGFYASDPTLATSRSDAYDPATNTWKRIADMPEPITHAPVVVDGETIYLLGGYVGDHPGGSTSHVWKYDTATDIWSEGPSLPEHRAAGGAAIVGRTIHYFGGAQRESGSNYTIDKGEHWALDLDASNPVWGQRAPMPNPRNHVAGASIGGKVYAIGGQLRNDEANGNQNEVDVYDPAIDSWERAADLPAPRGHITSSAFVMNECLFVIGGSVNAPGKTTGRAIADVTAYYPETDVWIKLPSLPAARKTPVADAIGDLIAISTGNGGGPTDTTWTGVLAKKWESGAAMPMALGEVSGGIVGNKLYIVGEGDGATLVYDLSTGTWGDPSVLATRPYPGGFHAAEVVDDKLYLLGGVGQAAGKVQIYDPATNEWKLGADMPFAAGSSSSAVIEGKIYVAGGIVGSSATTQAASYDPDTDEWTSVASMNQGRSRAATATDGKKLYVFGGSGGYPMESHDTVQVYDPVTDTWTSSLDDGSLLAPLPRARDGMGRAAYYDGEFYVMGGENHAKVAAADETFYDLVDVYDPAANTWRQGTPMPTARQGIYPLAIAGRIYVAGGSQAGAPRSPVLEVYNAPSDTTAPATPTVDLAMVSDTGASKTDDLTSDNTPSFKGKAEARSKVSIYDGTTILGKTTANGTNDWRYTTAEVDDGEHRITASATDPAGNTSTASAELVVTVDTAAPSAPTIERPADNSTNTTGNFTVSGVAQAESIVELFEGDAARHTIKADASGNWSMALGGVSDGSHTYTAKATEAAGNTSTASNPLTVIVDTRETTELSLIASPTLVPYGGTTTLLGKLNDTSTGALLAGKTLNIWRSTDGGATWASDGTAVYDASSETYGAARSLVANATFRMHFAGDASGKGSTSSEVPVQAHAWLSRPATPSTVRKNHYFTMHGYLKPYHPGYTTVYFYRYRAGKKKWVFYKSAEAANIEYNGYTKYSLDFTLPVAGKWSVKAYHADASHAPTWSPARMFYVR